MHALILSLLMIAGLSGPLSPPVASAMAGDALITVHQMGEVSAAVAAPDEPVVLMSVATSDDKQGQEPIPSLTTSWTDAKGVTHTVTTPIASQTPGGVTRAATLHNQLVDMMQRQYPPRPIVQH